MTLKKNSSISEIKAAQELNIEDIEYYRTDNIPTTGHFIREKEKDDITSL